MYKPENKKIINVDPKATPQQQIDSIFVNESNTSFYENNVRQFFESNVLSYTSFLKETEKKVKDRAVLDEQTYQLFKTKTDELLFRGEEVLAEVNNRLVEKRIKQVLRNMVGFFFYQGTYTKRSYEKPKGYPGDFRTLEFFYDETWENNNIVGQISDRYLLELGYVEAVRNRKDHMKGLLKFYLANNSKRDLRVLNIACGSARELRELNPNDFEKFKRVEISLLDQDEEALHFSVEKLEGIFPKVIFKNIQQNVLDYARNLDKYKRQIGSFDYIYSIGLADYIPNALLEGIIKTSAGLLKEDGRFVIAHKNLVLHKSLASDWLADWTFISRDKKEFLEIYRNALPNMSKKENIYDIKNGHVFFVELDLRSSPNPGS